jgi:DNA-binding NarL/FixJ family response regulator
MMPRLLVAEEHDVVRTGLRAILEAQPDWGVIAEAADGKDAILKAIDAKPDVAVINCALPLVSAIEVTRQIRSRFRWTEVLVFTTEGDLTQVRALIKAGARGFLTFPKLPACLIEAVRSLLVHKPFLTAEVTEELLASFLRKSKPEASLSNRERDVFRLMSEGRANRQIATLLDIKLKAVREHRSIIMRKLDLSSQAALKHYARQKRSEGAQQSIALPAPVRSPAANAEQSRLIMSSETNLPVETASTLERSPHR